ncbi:hypothetical protein M9458_008172, partial [Cirrhinus mrigala]
EEADLADILRLFQNDHIDTQRATLLGTELHELSLLESLLKIMVGHKESSL